MKRIAQNVSTLLLLILLLATAAHAQTPSTMWSKAFPDPYQEEGNSLAVDASGNVIMTGPFSNQINFGGSTLTSQSFYNMFLVKFGPAGNHLWSISFGDAPSTIADQIPHGVAVDPSGSIYVVGACAGTSNFGGANLVSAGGMDIFLAKYNASGVHQWSKIMGSGTHDYGYSVAASASGVTVTGSFAGNTNFGGGLQSSQGSNDIFVARYNSAGTYVWSRVYGTSGSDVAEEVVLDGAGNALVTGFVSGSVNFGGGALTFLGSIDIFLLKLDASGLHVWSKDLGGSSSDRGRSVAVDAGNNVILTGEFTTSTNVGGSTLTTYGLYTDVFLARYTSAGTHLWSKAFHGTGFDLAYAVATDASGNIGLTGHFGNIQGANGYTINFGGDTFVSQGEGDVFVASFDANGNHRVSGGYGGPTGDDGRDIAFDTAGNFLVTGVYQHSITFLWPALTGLGFTDIFLAKFAAEGAEPVIQSIVDVGNDQGRSVKISFNRSGVDGTDRALPVVRYDAYRRNDPLPPSAAGAAATTSQVNWQYVASIPAHGDGEYLMRAATAADSTIADGMHHSVFKVRAVTDVVSAFFDSDPDSGYSLDNLAPGAPSNFVYEGGQLTWEKSAASDFDFFTVYGNDVDDFESATAVDYSFAPSMDVSGASYAFYYVTATDVAGNEGAPAATTASAAAGQTPRRYVLSLSNYPNPFNPRTAVRYTVPERGMVTVTVFDVRGGRVATLVQREHAAGEYRTDWNGRSADGSALASGIYFARIEHPAGVRNRKMILLR